MVHSALAAVLAAIGMAALGNVCLHAEDWLDAGGLDLIVERDASVHVPVIGHGDCADV